MFLTMARKISNIIIHCTACFSTVEQIKDDWKKKGWKSPGYHRLITPDGIIHNLLSFDSISNGVQGHNKDSINISYVGGIDPKNTKKALDTRTPQQKASIIIAIKEALNYSGKNVKIMGHRDIGSTDANHNGIIDPWERIKECPSFDAITEYKSLTQ
jgi:N-acetylmuramoyl-L-alanine amidase